MEVRDAVKAAKSYVEELFADEGLMNLGLEEVDRDEKGDTWYVTVGFSRPWNSNRGAITALTGESSLKRAYRIVSLRDSDGKVLSVKRRDVLGNE